MIHHNDRHQVPPNLVNEHAIAAAKRLMTFLCEIYGKRMLTGQQVGVNFFTPELAFIHEVTGKYPAVGGFDFMEYSPSRADRGAVGQDTRLALEWWKDGGIVTFCWHWNAPKDLVDQGTEKHWTRGFYTEATTFDIRKAMDHRDSEDYLFILRDIDAIAQQLLILQEAGVPVLWRPLHEASGGWFWWGAKGPEPCIWLWKLMYERMTWYHKLNNLIWVWNGQHKDWYPGDEYVDVIGEDIYPPEHSYESQVDRFRVASGYTGADKIIALTENGTIPDPEAIIRDGACWAWNCTWYGGFLYKKEEEGLVYSEQHTSKEMFLKFYHHPYTITREELPDFRNGLSEMGERITSEGDKK